MTTETLAPPIDDSAAVVEMAAGAACAHCGLPVPPGLIDVDSGEQFCCSGCAMAYAIIRDSRLDDYYAIRDTCGVEPQPARSQPENAVQFDDPQFVARHVSTTADGLSHVQLGLTGLHCGACVWLVERVPQVIDGVADARVNLVRSTVDLAWDAGTVSLCEIARVVARLGYGTHALDADRPAARDAENRRQLLRLAIAGACAGNAMLIAFALYAGMFSTMAPEYVRLFRMTGTAIGVVAIVWPGAVFFRGAWHALRLRTPHIDIPVSLGLSAGGIAGVVNAVTGRGEVYFDTLALLVFLLLVGRYLQFRGQQRACDQVALLQAVTPRIARRVAADGTVQTVPAGSLQPDDVVDVRAGETIPADGEVIQGNSAVDESLLTGETDGRAVEAGDLVTAGATNLSAPLRVHVRAVGTASRIGQIMGLVEAASRQRPPIVQFADRISGWFVVVVLVLAAITLAWWWSSGWEQAVEHAVALLIVACPCALGLATPLTIAIAQGRAAKRSILVKNGAVAERLARPGRLWLDKTGTLTEGRMALRDWIGPEELKPLVATVEAAVAHPIADALARDLGESSDEKPERIRQVAGGGVTGSIGGRELIIGSEAFVRRHAAVVSRGIHDESVRWLERGWTPIYIAVDGRIAAAAAVGDRVRSDAAEAVAALKQAGWNVGILSGDHPAVVAAVAPQVGIDTCDAFGGLSPEDKRTRVEQSRRAGSVLMVGDGVNDSAALAAADVGIAVHGGAEVSMRAADVYIGRPGLAPLVELVTAGRRTVRIIRGNFAASLSYNLIAAALAMTGHINPLVAAVLMPISSLTVLAFALGGKTFDPAANDRGGA